MDSDYNGWSSWEVWEFYNYYGDEIQGSMENLLEESLVTKSELKDWLYNEVKIELESLADSLYSTITNEFSKSVIDSALEIIQRAYKEIADSFYEELLELCIDDEDEEEDEESLD